MINPEDVKKLEEQIKRVSQSTKTVIPFLGPIHDWLRRLFPWYYTWHTKPMAVRLHVIIIILVLIILAYLFLRSTADSQLL